MSQTSKPSLAVSAWLGAVLAGCSLSFMGVTALAPRITQDAALPPEAVGLFSGLAWVAALAASMGAGTVVGRIGPWPAARLCLLACALGLAAVASGQAWLILLGAVLIGLGNGLEAPPASQILGHHVAVQRRPFFFSLKQTGVQFGAVAASALLPGLALTWGWRGAVWGVLVLVLLLALALVRPARAYPVMPTAPASASAPRPGWWQVLRHEHDLRRLALAAATFGATQVCLNTFIVTWMVTVRGASLPLAGALAATAQAAGLLARPLWGWVASRSHGATPVLRGLGLCMAAAALALGLLGAQMPMAGLWPLAAVFGLSASGWNGVFLSEVASRARGGDMAGATAVAMLPVYVGLILGPLAFAALSAQAGLSAGFVMVSVLGGLGAWLVPGPQPRQPH